MIDTTDPDASHLAEAQRILRDRSRYQSRELEHVLGSLVCSVTGDRACQLIQSAPTEDLDSIVRGID